MKKIVLILLTACSLQAFCQMNLPEFSPEGKILQSIGYANFVLRYGRPAARGRKIFGELVPYGNLWRTGAGKCTTSATARRGRSRLWATSTGFIVSPDLVIDATKLHRFGAVRGARNHYIGARTISK